MSREYNRIVILAFMKITMIGAGNVATQLALALKKAGHTLVQIYNRSSEAGTELARTVGAEFTTDMQTLLPADIYIVAVKDDAIEERAKLLTAGTAVVTHTSGTKSLSLLKNCGDNYGIFYPLQTMTKQSKVDFKNVPVLIEGSNAETNQVLEGLARSISQNVHRVDEEQRQWIHIAAVFANNFTNHLFGISEGIMLSHSLSFEILKPLIMQSIANVELYSPARIQTGPAARGDMQTIEKHLLLLGDDHRLQQIYRILTESILASANQNHT